LSAIGRVKVPSLSTQALARKIHTGWIEMVEAIAPKKKRP